MMNTNTAIVATGLFSIGASAQKHTPSQLIAVAMTSVEEAVANKSKKGYKKEDLKAIKKELDNLKALVAVYKGECPDVQKQAKALIQATESLLKPVNVKGIDLNIGKTFLTGMRAENGAVGLFRGKAVIDDLAPGAANIAGSMAEAPEETTDVILVDGIELSENDIAAVKLARLRQSLHSHLKNVVAQGTQFVPSEIYEAGKEYSQLYQTLQDPNDHAAALADSIIHGAVVMIGLMENESVENIAQVHAIVDQMDAVRDKWLASQIRNLQETAEAPVASAPGETAQAREVHQATKPKSAKK